MNKRWLKQNIAMHGTEGLTMENTARNEYMMNETNYKLSNKRPALVEVSELPTKHGQFKIAVFENKEGEHHLAIFKGDISSGEPVLTRLHSECLTGDVFGSARCDCGDQLDYAMKKIEEEGRGLILYMKQEGRGIGIVNKIRAYKLQDEGADTVDANTMLGLPEDAREYGFAREMLKLLGVFQIRLMTNNPEKIMHLQDDEIQVLERIPVELPFNPYNHQYLLTKKQRMNHMLNLEK